MFNEILGYLLNSFLWEVGDGWEVKEIVEKAKIPKVYKVDDKIRAECCLCVYCEFPKILTHWCCKLIKISKGLGILIRHIMEVLLANIDLSHKPICIIINNDWVIKANL